jgi:toxin ParE1/3/4
VTESPWAVRLSDAAEADYDEILLWTARSFGAMQAVAYGELPASALARLEHGPDIIGARRRDDIASGLRIMHIGGRGRHLILYRVGDTKEPTIEVLRVLHDAMDLPLHVGREEQVNFAYGRPAPTGLGHTEQPSKPEGQQPARSNALAFIGSDTTLVSSSIIQTSHAWPVTCRG